MPCVIHPEKEIQAICKTCKEPFCEDCVVSVSGDFYCEAHAAELAESSDSHLDMHDKIPNNKYTDAAKKATKIAVGKDTYSKAEGIFNDISSISLESTAEENVARVGSATKKVTHMTTSATIRKGASKVAMVLSAIVIIIALIALISGASFSTTLIVTAILVFLIWRLFNNAAKSLSTKVNNLSDTVIDATTDTISDFVKPDKQD